MWCILLVLVVGCFVYFKLVKLTRYWERRGVVHEPSWPLVGNVAGVIFRKQHRLENTTELYRKYPNERYVGFLDLTRPTLLVRDLELIRELTAEEFGSSDGFDLVPPKNGEKLREMRAALGPVFASGKMRVMYTLMAECAENFVGHFKGKEQVAVEMKDLFDRFATDVIASIAFGIDLDSLEEPNNRFFVNGRRLVHFGTSQRSLGIRLFSKPTSFFRKVIKDSISKREKDGTTRPDLIHLLMEARRGKLKYDGTEDSKDEGFVVVKEPNSPRSSLSDDDIVEQALLFFLAGFDTASTASCFVAHELAVASDVQKKLQDEIDAVNEICKGKISHETLLAMKYLDQVICETLRLWPPVFQTRRKSTRDYEIKPKTSNEGNALIEKGTTILIPVIAIHRDLQYFTNPDRFDAERFNEENRTKIVPGSYIPFGIGPRNCIGSRFALLEMKTLLYHLLSKFDIIPVTHTSIPLEIDAGKTGLMPKNGFKLGLKPRRKASY